MDLKKYTPRNWFRKAQARRAVITIPSKTKITDWLKRIAAKKK